MLQAAYLRKTTMSILFLVSYKDGELWSFKLFVFWLNTTYNSNKQTSRRKINTILISSRIWIPNKETYFLKMRWACCKPLSGKLVYLDFTTSELPWRFAPVQNYILLSLQMPSSSWITNLLSWCGLFFPYRWQHFHLEHVITELKADIANSYRRTTSSCDY